MSDSQPRKENPSNHDQMIVLLITNLKKDVCASMNVEEVEDLLPFPVLPRVLTSVMISLFEAAKQRIRRKPPSSVEMIYHGISFLKPPRIDPHCLQVSLSLLKVSIIEEYISHGQIYSCSAPDDETLTVSIASYSRGIKRINIDRKSKSLSLLINETIPIALPAYLKRTYTDIYDLLKILRGISFLTCCSKRLNDNCHQIFAPCLGALESNEPRECRNCYDINRHRVRQKMLKVRKEAQEQASQEFLNQLTKVHPNFRKYVELQMDRGDMAESARYAPEIMEIAFNHYGRGEKGYVENRINGHLGRLPSIPSMNNLLQKHLAEQLGKKKKSKIHGDEDGETAEQGGTGKSDGKRKRKRRRIISSKNIDSTLNSPAASDQEAEIVMVTKKKIKIFKDSDEGGPSDDYVIEIHGDNQMPNDQVEMVGADPIYEELETDPLFDDEDGEPDVSPFDDMKTVFEYDGEKWVDRDGKKIDENYSWINQGKTNLINQSQSAVTTEKLPIVDLEELVSRNDTDFSELTDGNENKEISSKIVGSKKGNQMKTEIKPCVVELAQIGNLLSQLQG